MYQATITGVASGKRCWCDRYYYLNEYDEEVLYQEKLGIFCSPKEDAHVCAFTSTFIDRVSELRVGVDVEVADRDYALLATGSAEAIYKVQ